MVLDIICVFIFLALLDKWCPMMNQFGNAPSGTFAQVSRVHALFEMDVRKEILSILEERLLLKGRSSTFTEDWPLFSSLPEMDSMVVVSIISALEERFGIEVNDDEISGETFYNLGSLVSFVSGKLRLMGRAA